ncbi:MFS transporter [Actinomadura sp. WMMB 499]|uniref:MFS transporter n=1 Tax=Actinomadura sp. WMMB 499 TaxID=1219491 RepID=UPI0020C7E623|nr:MFS transporter [Actinomadura sp. WMMB 499]
MKAAPGGASPVVDGRPDGARPSAPARHAGWILACVVTVQFLVSLDLSLVNVALPAIQDDLGLSASTLNWVVVAYVIVNGGFLLAGGRMGDLLGRRRVLAAGLALFALASVAGGLATGGWLLVAARAVQGLGAAAASPVALALVTAHFPEGPARARALGMWAASTVAGGALGVVASGVLTETLGWRSVMLVNVPIAAFGLVAAVRLPGDVPRRGVRPDLAGAVLATAGMGLLVLGVSLADSEGWSAPLTLGPLAAGLVLLAAFGLAERRAADPLVRLGLFAHRAVLGANVFGFLITAGQLASFFFVSLHLQQVLGYDALSTGLAFLPFCLGSVAGMFVATKTLARVGPRTILVAGGLTGSLGIAWFGLGGPGGTFWTDVLGPSLVASVGIGASFVAMGSAATTGVPAEDAGMVSGLLNSFRLVGGAFGLAVLGTLATTVTGREADPSSAAAASAGFSAGLLAAACLLAAGALFCLVIPKHRPAPEAGRS